MGGHVALALARHLETRVFESGDDVGAVAHDAVLDPLHQVVPDQLARVGLVLQAGPQLRRLDVGAVAGLLRPRTRRVVRPAPAVLVVEGVAQRVEGLLPAGRRDVQALARLQIAPGREDVHVDAAAAGGSRGAQRPPRQPQCVHIGAGSCHLHDRSQLFPFAVPVAGELVISDPVSASRSSSSTGFPT